MHTINPDYSSKVFKTKALRIAGEGHLYSQSYDGAADSFNIAKVSPLKTPHLDILSNCEKKY